MSAINFPDPSQSPWTNSSTGITYTYSNGVWKALNSASEQFVKRQDGGVQQVISGGGGLNIIGDVKSKSKTIPTAVMGENAPVDPGVCDFWTDTSSDPPVLKTWNGSEWTAVGSGGGSGGGGGGSSAVVVMSPVISASNFAHAPSVLTATSALIQNATLQVANWYKDGVLIPGVNGSTYTATLPGVYKYEERYLDDNNQLLTEEFSTTVGTLTIAQPTVTAPSNGDALLTPFTIQGLQTIFPLSSIPGTTAGSVNAWEDADWSLSTDSSFYTNTQTSSVSISDASVDQAGPSFTYEAGQTYYMKVRYNSTLPAGQSSYSSPITFTTAADTYSIAGPSAIDEGANSTFTVTTSNVKNGDTLYWDTTNSSDFDPATGSFVINDNGGTFDVSVVADMLLEGAENFQFRLYTDSQRSNLVYTSGNIAINDTSRGFGQVAYTTPGTYSWTCPSNVTSVCVVAVGGGAGGVWDEISGGSGGGLGWKNNISVTPGNSYTVVVGAGGLANTTRVSTSQNSDGTNGGDSYFINTSIVKGGGASALVRNTNGYNLAGTPGNYVGDGGGNGGLGGTSANASFLSQSGASSGGGGAGGYSGNGGKGADADFGNNNRDTDATDGSGGGGGGGYAEAANREDLGGGGGGVGIYGEGPSGAKGTYANGGKGYGGSGGADGVGREPGGSTLNGVGRTHGGAFGGGGGNGDNIDETGDGGGGAVRIIWGTGRAFPSTLTEDLS